MIDVRREPGLGVGDPVLIRCSDAGGADALKRCLELAVSLGHRQVLVELGARHGGEADVLSVLHRTAGALREAGGRLSVVCRAASVRRLLDVTLLSESFSVHATRVAAIEALRPATGAPTFERSA